MKRISGRGAGEAITIDFEGTTVPALEGEPVACSLLAAGERVFARSIKYHRPRGPYCMAAACSHCLMRVDGVPNLYTCRTPARSGMRVERQNAYPSVKVDVFQSIDWLFPRGLDHHEMFAGVPVAEQVMAKVARHLAGLGILPDQSAPERLPAETLRTKVAIAGGGAAGSAAAETLTAAGVPFFLFERDAALGGRLATGAPVPGEPAIPQRSAFPEGALRTQSSVFALYDDDQGPYFAVTSLDFGRPRVLKVYADRFLICVGGTPQLPAFENNDLPGIYAGRAASLLVRRHGILPGQKLVLAGSGEELYPLATLLEANGARIQAVLDFEAPADAPPAATQVTEIKAHGRAHVSSVSFQRAGGKRGRTSCDALIISLPPSPSYELARQGGARVSHHPTHGLFVVEADGVGRTQANAVFAAGDALGPMTASAAAASGARAARAIVGELS